MEKIYIKNENNHYQYFETLKRNRTKRHAAGEFFVEGVRNINGAFNPENGWEINSLIFSEEINLSDWAHNIISKCSSENKKIYVVTKELLHKLSDKEDEESPSEIIITVKMKDENINDLTLDKFSSALIFDRPSNKGNLGTIIRSCDSFGIDALILTGHSVDLYDCETLRASMGSFFKQKIIIEPSFKEIMKWAEKQKSIFPGLQITGTSAKTSKPSQILNHETFVSDFPAIIVLGNETTGMSSSFYALCDNLVRIPMSENSSASSLNAACAASILLYEICKQKNAKKV
jgi:TrmH family RNA methyltransferase